MKGLKKILIACSLFIVITGCDSDAVGNEEQTTKTNVIDNQIDEDLPNEETGVGDDYDIPRHTYVERTLDDLYLELFNEAPVNYSRDIEYDNWLEMYKSMVYNGGERYDFGDYNLFYIDEDDIPELVCFGKFSISFCSWKYGGEWEIADIIAISEHTGKLLTKENDGINICTYNQGTINKESTILSDSKGMHWVYGIPLNDEGYEKLLENFDLDNATFMYRDVIFSQEEMLYILKTNQYSSYNHRYEIVMEDVSWEEAQEHCREKGGYLAVITSYKEIEDINEQLKKMDILSSREYVSLYVGCKTNEKDMNEYWCLEDGRTTKVGGGYIIASYPGNSERRLIPSLINGIDATNKYGMYFLSTIKNKNGEEYYEEIFVGPGNLPEYDSNTSGKVGYIIEYDE